MEKIRTFIAFDPPNEVKEEAAAIQYKLKAANADIRWEPVEKFHVTLKFLGGVDSIVLPSIIFATKAIVQNSSTIDVTYGQVGAFPSRKRPRVILIGCQSPDGRLQKLKHELDIALLPFGFEMEDRDFHPHITLGRVKRNEGIKNLLSILETLNFQSHSACIDGIIVMKSMLRPQGSEYSVLESIPFRAA